jgi:hypothetical protein
VEGMRLVCGKMIENPIWGIINFDNVNYFSNYLILIFGVIFVMKSSSGVI